MQRMFSGMLQDPAEFIELVGMVHFALRVLHRGNVRQQLDATRRPLSSWQSVAHNSLGHRDY